MKCSILNRQTGGKSKEIELKQMVCDQAADCRRRGICVLSDQAGLRSKGTERLSDQNGGIDQPVYLALAFDKSLGYFWKEYPNEEETRNAVWRAVQKHEAPSLMKRESYIRIATSEEAEKAGVRKGISDPLTARELARRELSDIDSMLPGLRSKIEFSRDCYLKMIDDGVENKRDYFDSYFRHYLIERLIEKKGSEPARG
jgi:hypothetical protein